MVYSLRVQAFIHQATLYKTEFHDSLKPFTVLSLAVVKMSDYNKDLLFCILPPFAVSPCLVCFNSSGLGFSVLPWSILSSRVSLLYTSCSIHHCWLIPSPLLPHAAGSSLLSGVLRAPLQPVVSAVCAQHRALPSRHRPLWVPVRLHWLTVQPRQVVFCDLCLLFRLLSNLLKFQSLLRENTEYIAVLICKNQDSFMQNIKITDDIYYVLMLTLFQSSVIWHFVRTPVHCLTVLAVLTGCNKIKGWPATSPDGIYPLNIG